MSDTPTSGRPAVASRSPEPAAEWERWGVNRGIKRLKEPRGVCGSVRGIEDVVPGKVQKTPVGTCFVLETRYPLEHIHGESPLSSLAPGASPSPSLVRLAGDHRLADVDYASAIFFDIETTGLGIGAGLVAFLVGFGTFEGGDFVLRQFFLRDYGEEPALLHLLSAYMRDSRWWISFNGRCFDLPVLQTRFICGRQRMPLENAPHLDLLYPARRLWRKRLRSCRLSSLESNLLGLQRESDVPGWLIPDLYFDYLRYGAADPLGKVFFHNALDILSLVTLAAKADQVLGEPFGAAAEHAVDLYSLGVICESWQQRGRAKHAYQQALQAGLPQSVTGEAMHRLAMLHKRTGDIEQALPIWPNTASIAARTTLRQPGSSGKLSPGQTCLSQGSALCQHSRRAWRG